MKLSFEAWRLVLDTALDAVIVMNRDGNVVDWNHNAAAIFGWRRDEVLGRALADLIIPPRLREAHTRGLRRFLETGEAQVLGRRIEICGVNRTGAEFPIELSISPIAEDNGPIFIGFLRDITARRNAEHTQEQHALKMEALYRTISYAAEDNSFEAALMVCLEAVHKLTGWPLGHVFVRSDTDPVRVLPSPVWFSVRPNDFAKFRAATEACSFALGEGLPGQVWQTRCPEWIGDVRCSTNFPRAHWPGELKSPPRSAFRLFLQIRLSQLSSSSVRPAQSRILNCCLRFARSVNRLAGYSSAANPSKHCANAHSLSKLRSRNACARKSGRSCCSPNSITGSRTC